MWLSRTLGNWLITRLINQKPGRVFFQLLVDGSITYSNSFSFSTPSTFSVEKLQYLPEAIVSGYPLPILFGRGGHVYLNGTEKKAIEVGRSPYSLVVINITQTTSSHIQITDSNGDVQLEKDYSWWLIMDIMNRCDLQEHRYNCGTVCHSSEELNNLHSFELWESLSFIMQSFRYSRNCDCQRFFELLLLLS